jgi:hypothetical protein
MSQLYREIISRDASVSRETSIVKEAMARQGLPLTQDAGAG